SPSQRSVQLGRGTYEPNILLRNGRASSPSSNDVARASLADTPEPGDVRSSYFFPTYSRLLWHTLKKRTGGSVRNDRSTLPLGVVVGCNRAYWGSSGSRIGWPYAFVLMVVDLLNTQPVFQSMPRLAPSQSGRLVCSVNVLLSLKELFRFAFAARIPGSTFQP